MHALAKIIAQHAGKPSVDPGEIVNVEPDYVMLHDRGVARVMQRFSEMGAEKVWNPSKVVVVFDHTYPAPRVQDAESQQRWLGVMAHSAIFGEVVEEFRIQNRCNKSDIRFRRR